MMDRCKVCGELILSCRCQEPVDNPSSTSQTVVESDLTGPIGDTGPDTPTGVNSPPKTVGIPGNTEHSLWKIVWSENLNE